MANRFTENPALGFLEQFLVEHNQEIAKALAVVSTVDEVAAGEVVFEQGSDGSEIFFIFSGSVAVEVNGREVGTRGSKLHFGEMALVDPSATRSASIRIKDKAVIARVGEKEFVEVAEKHPSLWRRVAIELSNRLRERGKHLKAPNSQPHVFVCSSVEGLSEARALQTAFAHDPWQTKIWTDGTFQASKTPIESLEAELPTSDFVIVVATADDKIDSRGKEAPVPRDNILFEIGLSIGQLGRSRTFIVKRREDTALKLPTDLMGVRALEITVGEAELASRIGPVADELRKIIKALGPR